MNRREFMKLAGSTVAATSMFPACAYKPSSIVPRQHQTRGIAILGAMPEEIQHYRQFVSALSDERNMTKGQWHEKEVLLGLTGIGMVDAAATTQAVIERYNPSKIIFTGVAGSLNEKVGLGDIAIVQAAVNYEMDVRGFDPHTYALGQHLFERAHTILAQSDSHLLKLCQDYTERHPRERFFAGYAATGSKFLVDERKVPPALQQLTKQFFNRQIAPLVETTVNGKKMIPNICDMETAAILRVANSAKIPAVVIRIVSDSYHGDAPAEFSEFIAQGVQQYTPLLDYLLRRI